MNKLELNYTILKENGESEKVIDSITLDENAKGQIMALKIEDKKKLIENFFQCLQQGHSPLIINPQVSQIDGQIFANIKNASFLITDENTFQFDHTPNKAQRIITCSSGTTSKSGNIKSFEFELSKSLGNGFAHEKSLNISNGSNILFPLPLTHSFGSIIGLLGSASSKHHLVCFDKTPTNEKLYESIERFDIDVLYLSPSLLRLFNKYLKRKKIINERAIKISIGAAHLYQDDLTQIKKSFPNSSLFYTYGLSEMGPRVSTFEVPSDITKTPNLSGLLPIGKAIDGVKMRVHDGKLMVQSLYAHADLAAKEIDSNDQASDIEGNIYILGRTDHTINYAGVNIYPEEIESLISKVIKEDFIIGPRPSSLYGAIPILIIESEGLREEVKLQLLEEIAQLIPNYIQINEIHTLKSFPKTNMGKIKRQEILKHLDLNA
ncbi:class I adenylate-forming enzyme family protein [Bacteriovorax sp. Seq25_V]|uniref:AMP-binding protein n=1 Tax=Bacteriovorax sp. Seq25_V TaxID=1201288 RepID=UPI000389FA79|nr:class I adenylate-forming enzyme family protein [Bacteriovorax sp. Seq25_V]EQC47664.1 AMP-binding enzyme domain protein [Bacteriovorax sp. Seq25_V]